MLNKRLDVWLRGEGHNYLERFENEQGIVFYTDSKGLTVYYTFDEGNEDVAFFPMASLMFARFTGVEDNS